MHQLYQDTHGLLLDWQLLCIWLEALRNIAYEDAAVWQQQHLRLFVACSPETRNCDS